MPGNYASECVKLPVLEDTVDMAILLDYTSDIIYLYEECSIKHKYLVEWTK